MVCVVLAGLLSMVSAHGGAGSQAGDEVPGIDAASQRIPLGDPVSADSVRLSRGSAVVLRRGGTAFPGPDDDTVIVLDRAGREVFRRAPGLDVPDAWIVNLRAATLRTDDRLVAAAFVRSRDDRETTVLLEYDLGSGELIRMVRTAPVRCEDLRADGEGTVWCAGLDVDRARSGDDGYDLVYRFGPDGTLVGSSLPRATYPDAPNPLVGSGPARFGFVRGGDGIVLLVPGAGELVRFDADGAVRDRIALPPWPFEVLPEGAFPRFVQLGDGSIAASVWAPGDDGRPSRQLLVALTPDGETWTGLGGGEAPSVLPNHLRPVGGDAGGLVVFDQREHQLAWLPVE